MVGFAPITLSKLVTAKESLVDVLRKDAHKSRVLMSAPTWIRPAIDTVVSVPWHQDILALTHIGHQRVLGCSLRVEM